MLRKALGAAAIAAFATIVLSVLAAEARAEGCKGAKTIQGTVLAACPQGRMLKLKTDCGREVTFSVAKKAYEQVKALNKGDRVEVTFVRCSKTKKLVVLSAEKL